MTILKRMDAVGVRIQPVLDRMEAPRATRQVVPSVPRGMRRSPWRCAARDLATVGLGAAGAIHVVWATGSSWPAADRDLLADLVVGVRPLPPAPMTLGVVGLIGLGIGLVRRESGRVAALEAGRVGEQAAPLGKEGLVAQVGRQAAWGVPSVLGLRGLSGLIVPGLGIDSVAEAFRRWNLILYSPLCLLLAGLAVVAIWPPRVGTAGTSGSSLAPHGSPADSLPGGDRRVGE